MEIQKVENNSTENIEKFLWKPVKGSVKDNLECIYKCPKGHPTMFHPNFINENKAKCVRKGCGDMTDSAKELCEFRGWRFKCIQIDQRKKKIPKVHFICNNGHLIKLDYANLRIGSNCKKCYNLANNKIGALCNCEALGIGFSNYHTWICEHYNHAALYPDSASEWDHNNSLNNGVTPDKLEPVSGKTYWFKCRECKMPHPQTIAHRAEGNRCPYCKGKKICEWNCLATTHPHLLEEWDYDHPLNKGISPTEVTRGTHTMIWWFCNNHKETPEDEPFRWPDTIAHRTCKSDVRDCPKCNNPGYEQKHGGHEHFVKEARKVHGDFYEYPEEYKRSFIKIQIKCPRHGIFKQTPTSHKAGHGCMQCFREQVESKPITLLKKILDELGIKYIQEKKFKGLKYKKKLRIDIYIPFYNLCIEYDGEQHFKSVSYWGGEKAFIKGKMMDVIKDTYCVKNGLNLLRIPYNAFISKELILYMIEESKKAQLYASYPNFMQQTAESLSESNFDFSKINAIPIEMPLK